MTIHLFLFLYDCHLMLLINNKNAYRFVTIHLSMVTLITKCMRNTVARHVERLVQQLIVTDCNLAIVSDYD